jgi:selenocysteine lyase/cysteine desulfurase
MIGCQRSLFSIPSDVVYLNTAYMSPLMNSVVDAINYGAKLKASPWDLTINDFFENSESARTLFANLVNVNSKNIALVPSASYGLETAAKNLKVGSGRSVVMLENQFPSHVYPWQRLVNETGGKLIKVKEKKDRNLTELVLEFINEQCAIVAVPNVLWTNGLMLDLPSISLRCKEVGAALVLDLTQSVGAVNTDLEKIDPDFAVVAAYKWMMSPYSTGYLYVSEKHWNGEPLEGNWISRRDGKNFSNLVNYTDHYEDGAVRFDVGERANFALLPGSIEALKQLHNWGIKNIEKTLQQNNSMLSDQLRSLGFVIPSDAERGPHFIGAKLPKNSPKDLLKILASNKIYLSERGGVLRITPNVWNNHEDYQKFLKTLSAVL